MEKLEQVEWGLILASRLGGKSDGSAYSDLRQQFDRVKQEIEELFAKDEIVKDPKSGKVSLSDQHLQGPTQLLESFGESVGLDTGHGEAIYIQLSGYTHPNALAMQLRMSPVEGPERSTGFTTLSVDVDYLRHLTSFALSSFYSAFGLFTAYAGWNSEVFKSWAREYELTVPEAFLSK